MDSRDQVDLSTFNFDFAVPSTNASNGGVDRESRHSREIDVQQPPPQPQFLHQQHPTYAPQAHYVLIESPSPARSLSRPPQHLLQPNGERFEQQLSSPSNATDSPSSSQTDFYHAQHQHTHQLQQQQQQPRQLQRVPSLSRLPSHHAYQQQQQQQQPTSSFQFVPAVNAPPQEMPVAPAQVMALQQRPALVINPVALPQRYPSPLSEFGAPQYAPYPSQQEPHRTYTNSSGASSPTRLLMAPRPAPGSGPRNHVSSTAPQQHLLAPSIIPLKQQQIHASSSIESPARLHPVAVSHKQFVEFCIQWLQTYDLLPMKSGSSEYTQMQSLHSNSIKLLGQLEVVDFERLPAESVATFHELQARYRDVYSTQSQLHSRSLTPRSQSSAPPMSSLNSSVGNSRLPQNHQQQQQHQLPPAAVYGVRAHSHDASHEPIAYTSLVAPAPTNSEPASRMPQKRIAVAHAPTPISLATVQGKISQYEQHVAQLSRELQAGGGHSAIEHDIGKAKQRLQYYRELEQVMLAPHPHQLYKQEIVPYPSATNSIVSQTQRFAYIPSHLPTTHSSSEWSNHDEQQPHYDARRQPQEQHAYTLYNDGEKSDDYPVVYHMRPLAKTEYPHPQQQQHFVQVELQPHQIAGGSHQLQQTTHKHARNTQPDLRSPTSPPVLKQQQQQQQQTFTFQPHNLHHRYQVDNPQPLQQPPILAMMANANSYSASNSLHSPTSTLSSPQSSVAGKQSRKRKVSDVASPMPSIIAHSLSLLPMLPNTPVSIPESVSSSASSSIITAISTSHRSPSEQATPLLIPTEESGLSCHSAPLPSPPINAESKNRKAPSSSDSAAVASTASASSLPFSSDSLMTPLFHPSLSIVSDAHDSSISRDIS